MSATSRRRLKAVFADYGPASLLRSGEVTPDGFEFEFVDTGTPVQGMARMVRGLEFDVVDMSPTTFLAARSAGIPLVALPVAMYAEYPHPLVWSHKAANVRGAGGLAGKTIGVRTWLNPATIFMRGMAKAEYGVEFDEVQWQLTVEDTIATTPLPPNAKRTITEPKAFKLLEMVQTGEVDVVIDALTVQWHHALEGGRVDPNVIEPVFEDSPAATRRRWDRFGFIPVMHMAVTKRETIEASPGTARALVDVFLAAKERYVAALRTSQRTAAENREAWLVARDRDNVDLLELGIDPLPAGEAVVRTLDVLQGYMLDLGYLENRVEVAAQFADVR